MNTYNIKNKKLNIKDFQHPADWQAVEAVTSLVGFEQVMTFLSENSVEKAYSIRNDSSLMKLSEDMCPKIYAMLKEAGAMFGTDAIPRVYLERGYDMSVTLAGIKSPFIIFTTSLLEQTDDSMLWAILVSEIAGIEAKHAVIKFVDTIFGLLKGCFPFAIDAALTLAIDSWYRNRAYTYDRAVLLVTEDFEKTAGYILQGEAPKDVLDNIRLDSSGNTYQEQAKEFLQREGTEGLYQKLSTAFSKKQWNASRYMELYNWYYGGGYDEALERSLEG